MKPVGFLDITKLTRQIILKNYKHFLCIAILWVIPYAFHVPVLDLSSFALDALVGSSFSLYSLIVSTDQFPALMPPNSTFPSPAALPPNNTDAPFPKLHLPSLSPIIARFFFSITIPFVSYPLLTFSVCRACLNKSLSLKASFLGVPRSAKNLALTSLCMGMVAFGFMALMLGMMGIMTGVVTAMLLAVRGNEVAALVRIVSMVSVCASIAMGIGGLYLAISLSLAHTVAILEEKRGWGALARSMDLLKGRKWMALGLVSLFYGIYELCTFGVLWRWRGASIVRVSLQALVALCSMTAHIVLYVSCKGCRDEPINTLMAASAQFGPQESAPKSMDVETAAFLSALPK